MAKKRRDRGDIVDDALSDWHVRTAMMKLFEQGMAGDSNALTRVLEHAIGKPRQQMEIESTGVQNIEFFIGMPGEDDAIEEHNLLERRENRLLGTGQDNSSEDLPSE